MLAGGSGTRLWPLSRELYPKQFLKIKSPKSLLQRTISSFLDLVSVSDLIIITNKNYVDNVKSDLKEEKLDLENIVLEPIGRNTAPAIALAAKYCLEKLRCEPEEVILVSPSDHIIKSKKKFITYLTQAVEIAKKGYLVTFGIKPTKPQTGYGYMKLGENKGGFYRVEAFIEKPSHKRAKNLFESGNYYWNSGIFAFRLDTVLAEFSTHAPAIYKHLKGDFKTLIDKFNTMPNISIDYAIMEKSKKIALIPMEIFWSDIGCWDSIYEILEKNSRGNAKLGNVLDIDTKNSLIIGERLIATIALKNLLVIETDDAILIAKRGKAHKTRQIVEHLKKAKRKEYAEHSTIYRPWGKFTLLKEGKNYKIKKITVYPKEKLSLQKHTYRSEHWIVIQGMAKVQVGDKETYMGENESIYIPKSTLHRLENPNKVNLKLIEIQYGKYLSEDDIVRLEDAYGRV